MEDPQPQDHQQQQQEEEEEQEEQWSDMPELLDVLSSGLLELDNDLSDLPAPPAAQPQAQQQQQQRQQHGQQQQVGQQEQQQQEEDGEEEEEEQEQDWSDMPELLDVPEHEDDPDFEDEEEGLASHTRAAAPAGSRQLVEPHTPSSMGEPPRWVVCCNHTVHDDSRQQQARFAQHNSSGFTQWLPKPILLSAVCHPVSPCRRPPPHTGSAPPPSALDVQLLHSLLRHMGPNRPTARALIARLPRVTVPAPEGQPQPADAAEAAEGAASSVCDAGQQQVVTAGSEELPQQQQQVSSEQQAVTAEQGRFEDSQQQQQQQQQQQEQQQQQVKVFCVAGEPCTVCHEDFVAGHQVLQLPCFHCFHEACLHPWLREVREDACCWLHSAVQRVSCQGCECL
jgi:hypothetical protein